MPNISRGRVAVRLFETDREPKKEASQVAGLTALKEAVEPRPSMPVPKSLRAS